MKRRLLPLLFLLISTLALAQTTTADEKEVQQTVSKIFDALSAKDAAGLRALCTEGVRFNEYGQAWTIDTLINKAITKNTAVDFKRKNELDFISTTVKNDVAWTTYYLHSSITRNGKQDEIYWMETTILLRQKKTWKVSVLQSTRIEKKSD